MIKNIIKSNFMRPFSFFKKYTLIGSTVLTNITTASVPADLTFSDPKLNSPSMINLKKQLMKNDSMPEITYFFQDGELVMPGIPTSFVNRVLDEYNDSSFSTRPIVTSRDRQCISDYFEDFLDWVNPLPPEIKRLLENVLFHDKDFLKIMFSQIDTSAFVYKTRILARVWEIFYICPLAPETFCFIFALYNVVKAALLYYTYIQPQKSTSILIPIAYKAISKVMIDTLYFQNLIILFLFINPIIFDRVLVMCTGLLMSHGFIAFLKIGCVLLFRVIIKYILSLTNILNYIFAIETYCLISFMMLFCLLLFASNHLILTLVLFEAVFFCLIPLMSSSYVQVPKNWDYKYDLFITKNSYVTLLTYYHRIKTPTFAYPSLSVYGTIQYYLYNAFFLGVYIFAISFLFFFSRSFSYFSLYSLLLEGQVFGYHSFIIFCFFCIISMICFKMGVVPYHGWMLSVFSNINIIPLMLLLLPFKLAVFSTGLRLFFGVLHPYLYLIQPFIFVMAFISMIFGAFGMFVQLDIRKFLLYSTINHSGYILIGMSSGTVLGMKATIFYIFIYLLSTLGFLIFVGSTLNLKTNKPFTNFLEIASVANLTIFPFIAFFIILLSMAGIPPFAGFFVKFFIIDTLFAFGIIGWIGILIIILTSTLTVIGYLRVIKFFFIDHTITTSIIIKTYSVFSVQVLFFVYFCLMFFGLFYGIYYYYVTDKDFYKIYSFFRLVL